MSFYIKELTINGNEKKPATVQFQKGLNIITGPSNTGKTLIFKCIDYIFGAKNSPLIEGYDSVSLKIVFDNSELVFTRYSGKKTLTIISSFAKIASGEYKYNTGKDEYDTSFNSILLRLLNINEYHEIVKNSNYEKQSLTWRTFSHALFLDEDNIISEKSPLFPVQATSKTSCLSAFIFLLQGKDFSSVDSKEAKEIKKAKRNALKEYINNELQEFSKQTEELSKELDQNENLEDLIESLTFKVEVAEREIVEKIDSNKHLLSQIQEKNEELSELNTLLNRYECLETQYNADLKRLNFIVDGQINYEQIEKVECPFCNNIVSISDKTDYITAAIHDYQKILMQQKDLKNTKETLKLNIQKLNKELIALNSEKKEVEIIINTVLKPQLIDLKTKLELYKNRIKKEEEITVIKRICSQKSNFLQKQDSMDDDNNKYDPKEYLDYAFTSDFSEFIKHTLQDSHFDNLNSVVFNNITMDYSVNGKEKHLNGKGYRAYYNSILSIAWVKYLHEKGKYKPNILFLDSPILSLKLSDIEEEIGSSIKSGFFELLRDMDDKIQVFVFENKLPAIDYKTTNIIRFTRDREKGRYGFIPDLYDK